MYGPKPNASLAKDMITIMQTPPTAGRISLYIPYQMKTEREAFKKLDGTFYHPTQKRWSIVNTPNNKKLLSSLFAGKYKVLAATKVVSKDHIKLSPKTEAALLANLKTLTLKGMSQHTINAYQSCLSTYFTHFEQHDFSAISTAEIEDYIYQQIKTRHISVQKQNQIINAIKSYYEHTLGNDRTKYNINRPKKSVTLPNVLSEQEVIRLINQPKNLKHKTILYTLYSAGLRLSELLNLRTQDIRSDDGYISVKGAKGKKDRQTVLSSALLDLLRVYYREYKPSYWLFEGQHGGKYSASSVQNIFRKAAQETACNAWATPHTLRHSFATHLMQAGTNLRYIQKALGHTSSKTTEIYTHVLNINNKSVESPLDILLKKHKFDTK